MARRRSEIEQERMTDANLLRVIALLEPKEQGVSPITKKDACSMLGMAYNTTRLAKILEEFKQKREADQLRRNEKRGKPASKEEIQYVIQSYLEGEPVDTISKAIFRGAQFVKSILEEYSVPTRAVSHSYFKPELIPEGAMRSRFTIGEVVYSARYDSLARIDSEQPAKDKLHGWVYGIFLLSEKQMQFAYQPADELASLEHIRLAGVTL